jgi:hypothetical protein
MRNFGCRAAIVLTLVVGTGVTFAEGQTASAPDREDSNDRLLGYVSINGGAQFSQGDLESQVTFPLYVEEGDIDASYTTPTGPLLDIGGTVRLWHQLGAGVAVTWYREKGTADLDARLPHPLHFGRTRNLVATIPDLDRVETTVHVQATWLAPASDRVLLALFGGPTVFRVEQDVITGIVPRETFPYDEVQLESATLAERKESAVGFHVGTDIQYRLTRHLGVGGVARFSRGTLTVATDADENLELEAGGLQLSGGVRWLF